MDGAGQRGSKCPCMDPVHAAVSAARMPHNLKPVNVITGKPYQAAISECDYVVERRPGSWFWKRWQVRPAKANGDYSAVFKGSHYDCLVVAQQLRCAVANGAWVALSPEYH